MNYNSLDLFARFPWLSSVPITYVDLVLEDSNAKYDASLSSHKEIVLRDAAHKIWIEQQGLLKDIGEGVQNRMERNSYQLKELLRAAMIDMVGGFYVG